MNIQYFLQNLLAGWFLKKGMLSMKNRKKTNYPGIFSYKDKQGKTQYGLKFIHRGTQVQRQGYLTLVAAKQERREIELAIEDGSYFKKDYTLDEYWAIYREHKISTKRWNLTSIANSDYVYTFHLKPVLVKIGYLH